MKSIKIDTKKQEIKLERDDWDEDEYGNINKAHNEFSYRNRAVVIDEKRTRIIIYKDGAITINIYSRDEKEALKYCTLDLEKDDENE